MSIYLARNGKMLTRVNGTRSFGEIISPITPEPTFDEVTISSPNWWGSQTWMSKNLAVDDGQGGIYTQTVNYGQGDVVEYYYTWDAAVRVAESIEGWHLPSYNEWYRLIDAVEGSAYAGTKLKSTIGWESKPGNDLYGFTALPAGYIKTSSGTSGGIGRGALFWSEDQYDFYTAYYFFMNSVSTTLDHSTNDKSSSAYSVRLIKDS